MQIIQPPGLRVANNLSDVADASTARTNLGILPTSGVSAYKSGAVQSIANATHTAITLDAEEFDDDGYHFTSAANLTGTVAKTTSSATLTGTGTAFTTELAVGQVISVPGTAAEVRVVTAIASNTSLTVNSAFSNTASGQTATRVNSALVAVEAGRYRLSGQVEFAAAGTVWTSANGYGAMGVIWLNTTAGSRLVQAGPFINTDLTTPLRIPLPAKMVTLAQWDFVELGAWQQQGAARNVSVGSGSTYLQMERVG